MFLMQHRDIFQSSSSQCNWIVLTKIWDIFPGVIVAKKGFFLTKWDILEPGFWQGNWVLTEELSGHFPTVLVAKLHISDITFGNFQIVFVATKVDNFDETFGSFQAVGNIKTIYF